MNSNYDAIVVGARCAGSPAAMLLARRGHRVLLVDRATFPSNTISTLVIHAPGGRRPRAVGSARSGSCDRLSTNRDVLVRFRSPGHRRHPPRPRRDLHRVRAPPNGARQDLIDAAAQAGVEVRERFYIDEVIIEDGTVVGVRGRGPDGASVVERARVVIGADGRNSRVARAAGAERYNDKPVLETAFYTYWSGLPVDGLTTIIRGDRGFAAIPTNEGLTLVLVGCPQAQVKIFRRDIESNYLAALEREPEFAKKIRAATREERILAGGVPNFFRKPFGAGWALVGDAGYTKDPITAQGISDAFWSAELCTVALDDVFDGGRPFEEAMFDYQQQRDVHALPLYEFTTQMATLEPPPPEMQQLLTAMQGNQQAMHDFVSVIAGTLSPVEFFDPANLADVLAATAGV